MLAFTATSTDRRFSAERIARARDFFHRQGKTAGQWAEENGYSPQLVYHVAAGRKACHWGTSHEIAVKIGLKDDPDATLPAQAVSNG